MSRAGFSTTFHLQVEPWPKDLANPHDLEAVEYTREGRMPFVPHIGMFVDCGDGDLRKVQMVYFNCDQPTKLVVEFADCELGRAHAFMAKHGWGLSYGGDA